MMAVIGIIFFILLIGGGVWAIYKGFTSGEIEYGYKYYPPKYIVNRKKDPNSFWFVVIVYSFAIIICTLLMLVSAATKV
jgi:hypothetical protein